MSLFLFPQAPNVLFAHPDCVQNILANEAKHRLSSKANLRQALRKCILIARIFGKAVFQRDNYPFLHIYFNVN